MCYAEKDQNSSEGTQKCSNNFGQVSILLKLAGFGEKTKQSYALDLCHSVTSP